MLSERAGPVRSRLRDRMDKTGIDFYAYPPHRGWARLAVSKPSLGMPIHMAQTIRNDTRPGNAGRAGVVHHADDVQLGATRRLVGD